MGWSHATGGWGPAAVAAAAGVTWEVDQGQGDQGHSTKWLVDSVHGELVEVALALVDKGHQDVPQEDVAIEEEEEEESGEDGSTPGGEKEQRDLLYMAGGGQETRVDRGKAQPVDQLQQQGLGLGAVAADEDLRQDGGGWVGEQKGMKVRL